jgi:hypothetical protein
MLITDLDHLEISSGTSRILGGRNSRIPLLSSTSNNQEISISYGGAEVYQGTVSNTPLSIQLTSVDDGTVDVSTASSASNDSDETALSSGETSQNSSGFTFGFSFWTVG